MIHKSPSNSPLIITHGTLKGGTGKTTSLFNEAGILAEEDRILLVDADPQFNITTDCGVDVNNPDLKTIRDVFESKISAEDVIIKSPIPEIPNLDLIPSSIALTATEIRIVNNPARERKFYNFIEENKDCLKKYKYILCDTNPNVGIINQNIFFASDSIVMFSDIDINSITGAEFFMALWQDITSDLKKQFNVKALFLNNADFRSTLPSELFEYCTEINEALKEITMPYIIPASTQLKKTTISHKPINILTVRSDEKKARQAAEDSIRKMIALQKERGIL